MLNSTPLQPRLPKRPRINNQNDSPLPSLTSPSPSTPIAIRPPFLTLNQNLSYTTPQRPLASQKSRKIYRNGYESKPKTPSYTPYKLNNPGHPRQHAFAFSNFQKLPAMETISARRWNELAISEGVLKVGQHLRDYQVEASNIILSRRRDLCVIAPTGAGKSLLWVLPLLAQRKAIAVVIIPYTSLGFQGEQRCGFSRSRSNGHVLKATSCVIDIPVQTLNVPFFILVQTAKRNLRKLLMAGRNMSSTYVSRCSRRLVLHRCFHQNQAE